MNEELKIIIKAVATSAKKEMDEVKQKLDEIKQSSDETGKSMDESMKGLAKGAAIAVGAVTAVTTAMVALGNKSLAAQKEVAKLVTAFQAVGSSAKQAQTTYTGLYRFLGDAGQATEAANHLAKITTNQQDLAEWTKILQGVYATFGASLPIESLTESANETLRVGQVTGTLADALNWAGVSEDAFNDRLATTTSLEEREALLRSTLNGLYMNASQIYERNNQALLANAEAQARLDAALAQAHRYLLPLMTAVTNLATAFLTYLKPALEIISAVLITFIQYIIAAIKWVGSFFSIFDDSGDSAAIATGAISDNMYSIGNSAQVAAGGVDGLGNSLGSAAKAAKELRKQTMGFDELNVVTNPASASGGSAGGTGGYASPSIGGGGGLGGLSIPDISELENFEVPGLDKFQQTLEKVKEYMEGILFVSGLILGSFLGMKTAAYVNEVGLAKVLGKVKTIGGQLLIVAGTMAMITGYGDAWATGVDWGNLALVIGGAAVACTGLYLAMGKVGLSVGIVTSGIALLVLGVKDFIENGMNLKNTILIIGGAIAVAVGLATAGLSVLVSAIVAAVAAIGAFVTAILLEKPAIMSVEDAQNNLTDAINRTIEADNNYVNAVDAAEASMKKLEDAEKKAGITGEELYKQVQSGTLNYADMTDAQKEVYKAYIDNEKKQKDLKTATEELNKAKKAETLASFENQLALAKESGNYEDYKNSVIEAFKNGELSAAEARDLISKSMSEMSDSAQQAFMKDIPSDITNGLDPHKYESTKTKLTKWFKNLWSDTKKVFSDVGDFFAKVGKAIGDAVSKAVKAGINGIISLIETRVNNFIRLINGAIKLINKIPGVNITKMKELSFPRLAKGGITNGSVIANIGEAGREAVLPLERNTEWMNTLADRIASRNSAPTKIVLNVDGKELGWATINNINNITKQTGGLQLAI
jgi:phage-related protein